MKPRIGSLFSGSGMLDEGVRSVVGGDVAWHAEVDPAACKVLAHRYPDVPNLGDITVVDWSAVAPVDVITGGSPCQDVSHAGKRAGMRAGTRSGLWARMCDAIESLRPSLVVWENVRGVLSAEADSALEPCPGCVGDRDDGAVLRALGRVLGDLAELGYDASWHGLRAADVGAPHGRFRVFVVATDAQRGGRDGRASDARRGTVERVALARAGSGLAADAGRDEPQRRGERRDVGGQAAEGRTDGGKRERLRDAASDRGPTLADAHEQGSQGGEPASGRDMPARRSLADANDDAAGNGREPRHQGRSGSESAQRRDAATDTGSSRREGRSGSQGRESGARWDLRAREVDGTSWGQYEPAIRRWEAATGRPAPAPTEPGARGGQRLSPRLTEWMMGWPDGWVTDVPGVSRNDALRICGNGVVPQQAAEAIRRMLHAARAAA